MSSVDEREAKKVHDALATGEKKGIYKLITKETSRSCFKRNGKHILCCKCSFDVYMI